MDAIVTPTAYTYQVVCFYCGTVYGAKPDSDLEARCKRRDGKFLDALPLAPGECPKCIEWERREIRFGYEALAYVDDPNPPVMPADSPIDGQLVWVPQE